MYIYIYNIIYTYMTYIIYILFIWHAQTRPKYVKMICAISKKWIWLWDWIFCMCETSIEATDWFIQIGSYKQLVHGVVVITTAQLHSTKPELRFCAGSNPARGVSEIRDGEDLWQWSQLEIRLNAFRQSTIPQKQFIIIINSEMARKRFHVNHIS